MKLIKNISTIIFTALALTACEDFLEPNSKSEFVPKDATSLNELLLGEAYQRNDMSGFNIFLGLLDDDIEAAPYQKPNDGFEEEKYLASFSWQPNMYQMMEKANSGHTNMYEKYYELILGTNAVLDYLPKVTDTPEMINIVKAQAHALRGFYYFNLVNIFGQPYNINPDSLGNALGVPLKLQSGIEESEDNLKRKSVAEVYAQILKDLHTAENVYDSLPEAQQWKRNFRTSLPMVQLILSRTYLYMGKWEEAAKYAKMVMENTNFKLQDLTQIPLVDDNGNPLRNYIYYPTYDSPETIWPYGNVEDMFGWTYYGANSANPNNGNKKMHAYFKASQDLIDSFEEGDYRKMQYIIEAPLPKENEKDQNEAVRYMPMAYGKIYVGTEYFLPKNATGVFGRCLRLSEAYLNYAEAQAHMGGDSINNANETLIKLRENRINPDEGDVEGFVTTDQGKLIEFIKEERRRELCFEGHRWFDLRRWGMPEIKHVWHRKDESVEYILNEKDLMYTVPIPDEAREENPQLVQNELPSGRISHKVN